MNFYRIFGLVLRHLYLYKRSLPRVLEVFYWPLLDLLVWGFVSLYISEISGKEKPYNFLAFFLGALILWDILFRSQQGISVSFLEDLWSRNLLNLFVTPMTIVEYIMALMVISVVKVVIVIIVSSLLGWFIYSFNFFMMGIALIPFVLNLTMLGWSLGIITTAIILRFGQQAEVLAWGIAFLFQPVSAVFYPVSILPEFMQKIAAFVPASYVFEGMRGVIGGKTFPTELLIRAFLLNCAYFVVSLSFFFCMFKSVREKGLIVKIGE